MFDLKKWRTGKKLKQSQLAELVGCSSNTIANWESGKTEPDASEIWELAKIFNVTPSELLEWEELASEDLTRDEKELIDIYREADDVRKSALLTIARDVKLAGKARAEIN